MLYSFCSQGGCTDGGPSQAGLVQDTNGSFYSTTSAGGANYDGTVFSLSVGLGPFVETRPTSGQLGATVEILGTNLTGATSVSFNGTAATFTVVSSSEISTTVPSGATTGNVQVVTPSGTLTSNVPFQVLPQGTAPLVSLSAPGLSFGSQPLSTTSAGQMETVTNNGTGNLTISTVTIGGTNASDFAKSSDTCSGGTVTPNGTCAVSVTFTPSATGSRSGSLNFTDNASNSPQKVALSGTGIQPVPAVSTGSASAITSNSATLGGSVNANGADTHVWFQYSTNSSMSGSQLTPQQDIGSGTTSVPISASISGLNGSTTYYFQAAASNSAGANYGSVVSFTTSGSPPTVGTCLTTVITSNGATLECSVNPNGADTHAWFQYSTNSSMGSSQLTPQEDIGSGTSSVPISASISGLNPSTTYYFQAAASNSGGANYGSVVSFTTGTGTAVSLSTTSLSFGAQLMGSSSLKTVTLRNLGSTPLSISSLSVVSFAPLTTAGTQAEDFTIQGATCLAGGSVAGLGSCTINLAFKPTAAGVRSATLVISDSDPSSPQTVSLTGTGMAVWVSPASLGFGAQTVGATSAPETVTLTNLGSAPLRIESLTVGGRDAGDFAIQSNSTCAVGGVVAGEGKCTINLAFRPSAAGARSATLIIGDSDPSSPQTVSLSGTGR